MELSFTCNSATNGNCTQISWLVNVLTKIQSSLHFSLHSRLRAFPVMCLPGFIPIWETEFSWVRMFPDKHIPEFIHSPIRAGIEKASLLVADRSRNRVFRDCNSFLVPTESIAIPGNIFGGVYVPGKYGKRVGFSRMLLQRGNVFIFKNNNCIY